MKFLVKFLRGTLHLDVLTVQHKKLPYLIDRGLRSLLIRPVFHPLTGAVEMLLGVVVNLGHPVGVETAPKVLRRTVRGVVRGWADKKRTKAPVYEVGKLVMLNGKHIKTKRPSKKLDKKLHGPFKISQVLSPTAVRLTCDKGRFLSLGQIVQFR